MPPVVTANAASRWAAMRTGHPATRRAALGFLLGGLASSVLAPGGACAAGDPRRRVALVMGNQNYEHVARLLNTANDAHAMADQLRQRGFDVVEGYDLNRPAMIQKLGEFLKKLSSGTIAVVYFAGHGVQANGENVLLPTDIRGDGEVE